MPVLAVLVFLALGLVVAPPAMACVSLSSPDSTSGPFPSPLGGAWLVLPPFEDGSLEALLVTPEEGVVRTVTLRVPGLDLSAGRFAIDRAGGFRVVGAASGDEWEERDGRWLVAFDADGSHVGQTPLAGKIFGFDAAARAYVATRPDERGLEIERVDALGGTETLFTIPRSSLADLDSSCRSPYHLQLADDGAIFLLTDPPAFPGRGGAHVLRRFTPAGIESAAWRLPAESWYALSESTGGSVLLDAARGSELWRIGGDGVVGRFDAEALGGIPVPLADGGLVVSGGDGLSWYGADGSPRGHFHLGATPRGMTWSDLEERSAGAGATTANVAFLGSGADAEAALAELRSAGPVAIDLIVDWLETAPEQEGYRRVPYLPLFLELLRANPDAVGERVTALLDRWPAQDRAEVVFTLVEEWPHPSAVFVAKLESWLLDGDQGEARREAARAFEVGRQTGGRENAWQRFPASDRLQRRCLDQLASGTKNDPDAVCVPDRFFYAQLPNAGPLLDSVLDEPGHPAHPAVVAWLEALPARQRGGKSEAEGHPAAVEGWAKRWSASSEPRVATAARLLAAAAGDPATVARLPALLAADPSRAGTVDAVVRRLVDERPELVDAGLVDALGAQALLVPDAQAGQRLLRTLAAVAQPSWWDTMTRRLTAPGLPMAALGAVAGLLADSPADLDAVSQSAWSDLAASDAAERLFASANRLLAFRFAGLLWDHLEADPQQRSRVEDLFLSACHDELEGFTAGRKSAASGEPCGFSGPGSCVAALAESGIGRKVPNEWLTAHLRNYACISPVLRVKAQLWQRGLSAAAARRGPWPGLTEVLRQDFEAVPTLTRQAVAPAVLAATLGPESVPGLDPDGRSVDQLPLLRLPRSE